MHHLRLVAFAALCVPILGVSLGACAAEKPVAGKAEAKGKPAALTPEGSEDKGDRARRLLDQEADRLDRDAKRVMQTICRGC